MSYLDNFLNSITMYKLVLYVLTALSALGVILSAFGFFDFTPFLAATSLVILLTVCHFSNIFLGKLFNLTVNVESDYITGFILFLILPPPDSFYQAIVTAAIAVVAMASKYVLNVWGKHLFNPAAVAVVLFSLFKVGFATWWVGSAVMLPAVIIGGFLIIKKIRRFDLVIAFVITAFVTIVFNYMQFGSNFLDSAKQVLFSWPIFFFASVMLTEPQATPPTRSLRILYAVVVGLMFGIPFRFGPFYNTPELALVVGNIFSYLVSPKQKLILHLKEKISLAPGIYNFIFTSPEKLEFSAGQYIEWTLGHNKPDNRGNRRYFTIASSPTEKEIILGAKFYEPSSTFKKKLLAMPAGESVIISQLAGDFTLPKDVNQPVVFIAGGIGVTPFRSMVKYMLDTQQKRPATLFFSNRSYADIVYKDIFDQAEKELGMKVVYAVNDLKGAPVGWKGHVGFVDEALIKASLPEYNKAIFYVSGPHVMVDAFQKTLSKMGVPRTRVRTDFFPGYA